MKSADRAERRRFATVGVRAGWTMVLVASLLSSVRIHQVGAEVDEAMLGLGGSVLEFPGAPPEPLRVLELNGVSLSIRSQVVDLPIAGVVDHYRSRCLGAEGSDSPLLSALRALSTGSALREGVGYVACVDVHAADLETLARRLGRFSATWDLSDLGALRYVYLRRSVEQPASSTSILAIWADGPFDLRKLLPVEGRDAYGADLVDVPRPPDSRRIIYARETFKPSTLVAYRVRGAAPDRLLSRYRADLARAGWSILERSRGETTRIDDTYLLSARKEGRLVTVLARPADAGEATLTLLETRSP